jgi:predicted unusual protein kinase regulating ubiquinone biosynthesis (AarF/ABC1/UbiB family)
VLEDGRVGFIDFGIVGRIPPKTWKALTAVLEGFSGGDWDLMADGLIDMGATAQLVDRTRLAADLKLLVERLQQLDAQVVVTGVPGTGVEAALAVDEEQVRP